MSMTISRNSTDINGLKDLLNKLLMPQEFHVPASRRYKKRILTLKELLYQLQQRHTDTDCVPITRKMYHLYQAKEHVTLVKFLVVLKEDNRGQLSASC